MASSSSSSQIDDGNDRNDSEPIVLTLEAKFHGVRSGGWNNKLIQIPKGGILWGLHIAKTRNVLKLDMKVVASVICFGPITSSDRYSNWAINFDHAFTVVCKRTNSASPIQKSSNFTRQFRCVRAEEWGERKLALPENWGTHDNVRLTCHMYINQTVGLNRGALRAAATPDPLKEPIPQDPVPVPAPMTSAQIEGQVMTCYTEMLVEEDIEYTSEGFQAVEKLAKFFCYPMVLDICKKHLMKMQALLGIATNEVEDGEKQYKNINLQGFDYPTNCPSRRQRMRNLNEGDVVDIFQHLTSIVFKKETVQS